MWLTTHMCAGYIHSRLRQVYVPPPHHRRPRKKSGKLLKILQPPPPVPKTDAITFPAFWYNENTMQQDSLGIQQLSYPSPPTPPSLEGSQAPGLMGTWGGVLFFGRRGGGGRGGGGGGGERPFFFYL